MQRRAYDRINVKLDAMFYWGSKVNTGVIANISENGMLITTRLDFPFDIHFDIHIPLSDGILNVPVKISRLEKTNEIYEGIGVEVANPSQIYLDYIKKLRALQVGSG